MSWLALIPVVVKYILRLMNAKMDSDIERKEKKKKVLNEVKDGIKKGDASAVNRGFNKLRRL